MRDFLKLTYIPGPQSIFSHIIQLPAGHYLKWTPSSLHLRPYWTPSFSPSIEYPTPSFRQAQSHLLNHLQRAVQSRLVSDVPIGLFLSGGLDSTALLYATTQTTSHPIQTFTARFQDQDYDESSYASQMAQLFGSRHHEEVIIPQPTEFLETLIEDVDGPFADSSSIPLWYLCKQTKPHATVILGGDGGDELLAGYRTHQAALVSKLYRSLPKSLTQSVIPKLIQKLPVGHGKVSLDFKLKQFAQAGFLSPAEAHYRFKDFLSDDLHTSLFKSTATHSSHSGSHLSSTVRHFENFFDHYHLNHSASLSALSAHLYCDQRLYLADNILVKSDRVSMGHHLELRVPFLDHHLVEWINQLPFSYKLRGFKTKALLKEALRPHLPSSIIDRPKAGFNVPMARWLLGPLKEVSQDYLSADAIHEMGLWDYNTVRQIQDLHQQQHADYSRPLWSMLCFMIFYHQIRHL